MIYNPLIFRTFLMQSTGAGDRNILDTWKDINQDPKRPVKVQNAHANMKWWLERHFPSLRFQYIQENHEDRALESIVRSIDGGFPVLVAISHARVHGHITGKNPSLLPAPCPRAKPSGRGGHTVTTFGHPNFINVAILNTALASPTLTRAAIATHMFGAFVPGKSV